LRLRRLDETSKHHRPQAINGTQWGQASGPTSGYAQGVVSPTNVIFNSLGRQVWLPKPAGVT